MPTYVQSFKGCPTPQKKHALPEAKQLLMGSPVGLPCIFDSTYLTQTPAPRVSLPNPYLPVSILWVALSHKKVAMCYFPYQWDVFCPPCERARGRGSHGFQTHLYEKASRFVRRSVDRSGQKDPARGTVLQFMLSGDFDSPLESHKVGMAPFQNREKCFVVVRSGLKMAQWL